MRLILSVRAVAGCKAEGRAMARVPPPQNPPLHAVGQRVYNERALTRPRRRGIIPTYRIDKVD